VSGLPRSPATVENRISTSVRVPGWKTAALVYALSDADVSIRIHRAGRRVASKPNGRTATGPDGGEASMSFNRLLVDQPGPQIAGSAVVWARCTWGRA